MTSPSESCLCGHVLEDTRRFICGRRFTGKLFLNTWLQAMLKLDMLGVVATRQVDGKKDLKRISRWNTFFGDSYWQLSA